MDHPKLNDQTSLGINIKWLIQIIVLAAMIVWGYFGLTSKISHLETDVLRMKDSVTMNSEFRVKWPPPHPFLPAVGYPKKTEAGGIR